MFRTSEMEEITGKADATIRTYYAGLPMESTATRFETRRLTMRDAINVLIADTLINRGFAAAAALAFTSAMAGEVEPTIIDDTRQAWLVAWADPAFDNGYGLAIVRTPGAGLDIALARPDARIFCIPLLIKEAMLRLLELTPERADV